ncbi:restriction endonuclease [Halostagnicola sp. A-GB9-2]|uniref:restriction endonuclease n=1 Tax=Halostagnicola sp. A-GB9-2 TaxID=3048066 RepID=UPI0024C0E03D|nr:restriction endonuclease [Halostagnicola sp. A-GB9-2]MDJ1431160.1 restriction endonuclease [Halostagnicola sp. A-GB9-2]
MTPNANDETVEWDDVDSEIYERIVAGLEDGEGVDRVETRYDLPLNHGGSKEVDVAVWTNATHHSVFIVIECKFWSYRVDQSVIAETMNNVANSTANIGVVVSKSGFQSGAIEQALGAGIELYELRRIEDEDLEGRIQTVNNSVTMNGDPLTVQDIRVLPVDDSLPEADIEEDLKWIRGTPENELRVYTPDREPTSKTFQTLVSNLPRDEPGTHTETFEDTLLKLDTNYYTLEYIEYLIEERPNSSTHKSSIDINDLYDLVRINTIQDSTSETTPDNDPVEFVNLNEAITAFTAHHSPSE